MSRCLCFLIVLAAACGGSESPATTSAAPRPAGDDPHALCVSTFQRQRECTDDFIPALVDLRVRRDSPAGIAEQDRELGRDALVARAKEEWRTDSTDEAIGATCTDMITRMPPETQQQVSGQARDCLAAGACGAFVDCLLPLMESQLR